MIMTQTYLSVDLIKAECFSKIFLEMKKSLSNPFSYHDFLRYSINQPHDWHGRWTDANGNQYQILDNSQSYVGQSYTNSQGKVIPPKNSSSFG